MFEQMKSLGVPRTEHIPAGRFWASVKEIIEANRLSTSMFDLDDIQYNDNLVCIDCMI